MTHYGREPLKVNATYTYFISFQISITRAIRKGESQMRDWNIIRTILLDKPQVRSNKLQTNVKKKYSLFFIYGLLSRKPLLRSQHGSILDVYIDPTNDILFHSSIHSFCVDGNTFQVVRLLHAAEIVEIKKEHSREKGRQKLSITK